MTTNPDAHTLTGPYVLNALPEDQRIGFEAHLADCQSCGAEVTELREAATRLGHAVAEPPPPDLKARVMMLTATTRQLPPPVQPSAGVVPAADGPPSRIFGRRSLFALAASAAAAVGAGGFAYDQYRENQRTQRENELLAALLAEPDARMVRGDVSGGGQATVVMSARRDSAVVLLHGLRQLPDDRSYQLWLMDETQTMHPVGLASGQSTSGQTRLIDDGVADKIMFGLTVEQKGGASEPTLPPVALIAMA
jgi:anti-sigma-K factor RskA